MNNQFSHRDRQFDEYLRDGITAAKSGDRKVAQMLLNRALMVNKWDARPYLWLSATTDDPQEQKEYLEQALIAEPNNAKALRGLAVLTGKIDQTRLMGEAGLTGKAQPALQESQAQSFACPQCGGKMTYSVQHDALHCEYCGHVHFERQEDATRPAQSIADRSEQVLGFVMPTTTGHHWAMIQHRLSCDNCGAVSLMPAGQKAGQCAYCGSNQLVDMSEQTELIDPQVIAVMSIDEQHAIKAVKEWLGRGIFVPDDLLQATRKLQLRPAYYSGWTFDGTLEVTWSCEVQVDNGSNARWESRNGVETRFFNDVLVPGVRSLKMRELASIEPFNLPDVEQFSPEYLAGWPTVIYDRSLSDASLLAREKVLKQLRPQLYHLVEAGRNKRNLKINNGKWSGMTFKHVLLPIWIGTYHYKDKEYHLLINGQTGKVGGYKPRDTLKLIMIILIGIMVIVMGVVIYWVVSGL